MSGVTTRCRPPTKTPPPPIWAAGILSPETIRWAARQRITYLVLGSALDATATCRDIYHEVAQEDGWVPTSQHLGYLIHACVLDTDEEAYEMGRHHYGGASVIGRSGGVAASALTAGTGSAGVTGGGPHPEWMAPPGYMSKQAKTGNMARERRMSEGRYRGRPPRRPDVPRGPQNLTPTS